MKKLVSLTLILALMVPGLTCSAMEDGIIKVDSIGRALALSEDTADVVFWTRGMAEDAPKIPEEIPESVMFSSSFHIMLAAATRYAMGLVYVTQEDNPERELSLLKEALLRMYVVEQ